MVTNSRKIYAINLYYSGLTSLCLTDPGPEVGLHRARPHRVPRRLVLLQLPQLCLVVRALGARYTAGAANTWTQRRIWRGGRVGVTSLLLVANSSFQSLSFRGKGGVFTGEFTPSCLLCQEWSALGILDREEF